LTNSLWIETQDDSPVCFRHNEIPARSGKRSGRHFANDF
jgi:hypothetical protein